jgi:NAD(P)-dependent dehydrogenase (short-subunit alcohol dehydrogenase family)
VQWSERDTRVNSISLGIIMTPLAQTELDSERGPAFQTMIGSVAGSTDRHRGRGRSVAASLLGPDASFITGSDLLMDGGVTAARRSDPLVLSS